MRSGGMTGERNVKKKRKLNFGEKKGKIFCLEKFISFQISKRKFFKRSMNLNDSVLLI